MTITTIKYLLTACVPFTLFLSCTDQKSALEKQENVPINAPEQIKPPKTATNNDVFQANSTTHIDSRILSIFQDKNNNYWIGTNAGVYRYDGKTLIVFTTKDGLCQDQVLDIQEDESGNIWFATGGYGVSRFDGQTITKYTVKANAPLHRHPEKDWKIEPGDLWFNAGAGAFRYNKDSFTYLPFPNPDVDATFLPMPPYKLSVYGLYATLKDKRGNLWFGTQSMGVCRYDGKTFHWLKDQGLSGPAVLALFEDRNGTFWFGNNGNGLFRYDGKTLTNFTAENGLSNPEFIKSNKQGPGTLARILAINEDNSGTLWVGTVDAGVWSYDGRNLLNYTAKDGLPNNAVETIYKDKKGTLWFGTNGAGVYKFNGTTFTSFAF